MQIQGLMDRKTMREVLRITIGQIQIFRIVMDKSG